MYTGNKFAKFHGNILSLRENIAKSFRGLLFFTHTVYVYFCMLTVCVLYYLLSVSVYPSVFTYCLFFAAIWRINVLISLLSNTLRRRIRAMVYICSVAKIDKHLV